MKFDVYSRLAQKHYSDIAHIYRNLRKTDSEPVLYVKSKLSRYPSITAADVGAGAGRYAKLLFDYIGYEKLYLHCVDTNEFMLDSLEEYLRQNKVYNFKTHIAKAEELPFKDNELDCIFCFNSIDYFKIDQFFRECIRVLKDDGYIFIYTKTRSQNNINIWGKYFPLFRKKESLLYEEDEFRYEVEKFRELHIEEIQTFRFERNNTIEELVDRAKSKHYFTFTLYDSKEFAHALKKFRENLEKNFSDTENIEWIDGKIMYVLQKKTE